MIGVLALLFLVSGCASATFNYSSPTSLITPDNEVAIDEPFDVVWDRMIKNLSADFFVINNIEKVSRLMNVSFSTTSPGQYIDCGRTRRTFTGARGEQVYEYASTDSSKYTTVNPQGAAFNVFRTTKLEGRLNIYVAPEGGKTVVRVNSRYILNIQLKGYTLVGQFAGTEQDSWAFNTKVIFEKFFPDFNLTVKCVSLGTLENKVLQAAKFNNPVQKSKPTSKIQNLDAAPKDASYKDTPVSSKSSPEHSSGIKAPTEKIPPKNETKDSENPLQFLLDFLKGGTSK